MSNDTTPDKPKRTRRAITPATALANTISMLEKLDEEERQRVLGCVAEYFKHDLGVEVGD